MRGVTVLASRGGQPTLSQNFEHTAPLASVSTKKDDTWIEAICSRTQRLGSDRRITESMQHRGTTRQVVFFFWGGAMMASSLNVGSLWHQRHDRVVLRMVLLRASLRNRYVWPKECRPLTGEGT